MRKSPLLLSLFFVTITLVRVAHFASNMGASWLSYPFSVGLGLAIFATAYWTQYRGNPNQGQSETDKIIVVSRTAWSVLTVIVILDGMFNLADVLSTNPVNVFSLSYGIAPTILILLFGILQARVDRLPAMRTGSRYQIGLSARKAVTRIVDRIGMDTEPEQEQIEPEPARTAPVTKISCPVYTVTSKEDLTDVMIAELRNGHSPKTLAVIFPNVTGRTIRRWKREINATQK